MRKITAFIAFAAFGAAPLLAQVESDANGMYELKTEKGCIFYSTEAPSDAGAATWSGPCTAGQPLNGQGTLIEVFFGGPVREGRKRTGTMQSGVWNGKVVMLGVYSEDAGPWQPDTESSPMTLYFKMGCLDFQIDSGWCKPRAKASVRATP